MLCISLVPLFNEKSSRRDTYCLFSCNRGALDSAEAVHCYSCFSWLTQCSELLNPFKSTSCQNPLWKTTIWHPASGIRFFLIPDTDIHCG